MEILQLNGLDKKLYELVAPLVMNPTILRQNNNYPFKTSFRYVWYIALEKDSVIGFMPLKSKENGFSIDNYYISGDSAETLEALLHKIQEDIEPGTTISALVHKRHSKTFDKCHFSLWSELTNYDKRDYTKR